MKIRCEFIFASLFLLFLAVGPDIVKAQVACGDIITTDTTLDDDIGPCAKTNTDPALTVQAPATLNLNGFSVSCDPSDRPEGIRLTGEGATLLNGIVKDCSKGVVLMGTGHHRVEQVVAMTDFQGPGFLVAVGSNKNMLVGNAAANNDPGFDVDGDKCTLTDNFATHNDDSGFEISGSQHILRQNVSVFNDVSGFDLAGMNFKVFKNTAQNNDAYGFYVWGSGHTINQNRAFANDQFGILLEKDSATASELSGNVSLGHVYDLADENPACDNNAWEGNLFGTRQVNDGTGDQTCIE